MGLSKDANKNIVEMLGSYKAGKDKKREEDPKEIILESVATWITQDIFSGLLERGKFGGLTDNFLWRFLDRITTSVTARDPPEIFYRFGIELIKSNKTVVNSILESQNGLFALPAYYGVGSYAQLNQNKVSGPDGDSRDTDFYEAMNLPKGKIFK